MKRISKIGTSLSFGFLAILSNLLNANDNFCETSCSSGFELSVDFLYWKTCMDDLTSLGSVSSLKPEDLVRGVSSRDVEYHNLCPKWKPGFRINIEKDDIFCGLNVESSYTWLKSKASNKYIEPCDPLLSRVVIIVPEKLVESPVINPEMGSGYTTNNFAKARYESLYQNWDLLFSYKFYNNENSSFHPFFGIASLAFNQDLQVEVSPFCGSDLKKQMVWGNNFFGVGFKAGSLFSCNVCDCLSLFAKGSITVITGNSDNKYNRNRQSFVDSSVLLIDRVSFYDDNCCQFVPGWHMQLGVNYTTEYCGYESSFHLGWEYQLWKNINNPRIFTGNPNMDGDTVAELSPVDIISYSFQSSLATLGYHGLFVGLDVKF